MKYKHAMRNLAASVSILTHQKAGEVLGVTVTSATSYAAEPPIFMAAIHKESTLAERLSLGDKLAMNLLKYEDQALAERFAGQTGVNGHERFKEGKWIMDDTAAPRLETALACFNGHLRALIPQASHAILLVEIDDIVESEGHPLIYHQQSYKALLS